MCSCWQNEVIFIFIFVSVEFFLKRNVKLAGECDFLGHVTFEEGPNECIEGEKDGRACAVRVARVN